MAEGINSYKYLLNNYLYIAPLFFYFLFQYQWILQLLSLPSYIIYHTISKKCVILQTSLLNYILLIPMSF